MACHPPQEPSTAKQLESEQHKNAHGTSSPIQQHNPASQHAESTAHLPKPKAEFSEQLSAKIRPLNFESTCGEVHCPKIAISRLDSNQPQLNQAVDQYILNYCQKMLEGFDFSQTAQVRPSQPAATTAQSNLADQDDRELKQKLRPFMEKMLLLSQENKSYGNTNPLNVSIQPKIVTSAATKRPVATVLIDANEYLGGAHGNSSMHYISYDRVQHKILTLDDVLFQGKQQQFHAVAYAKFVQWFNETMPDSDLKDYQNTWNFELSDNFYFSPDGLILQYQHYEIGPYAVGMPRLMIPYRELQGIIKPLYLPNV